MHQTLYRKYRPKNFEEVVGQKVIITTLKNAIKNNKLSHAYLFCGPRGTGKTSIAKILAKTVNCENLENYNPCNKCVNCTQYNNKQATDIIEIDAASNNGVEEIRELKSKISLVPSTGKYKIYIIDEVHMLSIGAFNALLKTLEEPPNHIIFILATTDPQKIPATILSRCQRFDFKKIEFKEMINRLDYVVNQEKINIEPDALKTIATYSDGGMRDALSLLDQAISYTNDIIKVEDINELNGTITEIEIKNFIIDVLNKNIAIIFSKIDNYYNEGKDFYKITEEIILYLRNVIINKNVPNYFNNDIYNLQIEVSIIFELIKNLNDCLFEMKNSFNNKLIFELLILKLINKEDKEKITEENKEQYDKKIEKNNFKIENINKIRINNTLCFFNKKEYINFKNDLLKVKEYLINKKYSQIVSLIIDGEVKAYGNDYFIIVFNNYTDKKIFNENYLILDELMNKCFNKNIHGTAVDLEEWNKIKIEFNNKQKEYKYIEE